MTNLVVDRAPVRPSPMNHKTNEMDESFEEAHTWASLRKCRADASESHSQYRMKERPRKHTFN